MSQTDVRPLPERGQRPAPRYTPPRTCTHHFGVVTTLEEIAGVPLGSFAGRRRFKNEAQVCDWCGLIVGIMR